MRAVRWKGIHDVAVEDVPDPAIQNPRDAIVRVSSTAVCGSDLHLYDGYIPTMRDGDVLGHEFMGEVVDVGPGVSTLQVGDRVVVPFPIACGDCNACARQQFSVCENSNPNAGMAEKLWGHTSAAIYGYSHLAGGYAGGQAEYVRVPYADVGPLKVETDLPDEKLLFLTDVLPTGYMGAELCDIGSSDVVAVWGAGAVGQFAAVSAMLLGADRVIVVDDVQERLQMARDQGAEIIDRSADDVLDALKTMTGGRGPDACIDAVGMEAHHELAPVQAYDKAKQFVRAQTGRPHALREAILACRSGGTVSVLGVYGGLLDKFPMGAIMNRSLTLRSGQCHVHRYLRPLLDHVERGDLDPSFVVTHRRPLEDAPGVYDMFRRKQDGCVKAVLHPDR